MRPLHDQSHPLAPCLFPLHHYVKLHTARSQDRVIQQTLKGGVILICSSVDNNPSRGMIDILPWSGLITAIPAIIIAR